MNFTRVKLLLLLLTLPGVVAINLSYGHSGATGVVKERMDAMKDMGKKSKHVADMFKGKMAFDLEALRDAASSFSQHGAKMVQLFPNTVDSRESQVTEALPLIWENWQEFNEYAAEFVELSDTLNTIVMSTDDYNVLRKAFRNTSKSCYDCHKRFKKPER